MLIAEKDFLWKSTLQMNGRGILGLISRSIFHSEIKQRKEKNELIEQIISEFYTSMQNPVIINELAKKFSISTNYLIRDFKNSTGKTPAQYAIDMRIKKAEELLSFSATIQTLRFPNF